MKIRYYPIARKDIKDALKWSIENFGELAAQRYKHLIRVGITEIADNPALPHSYSLPGLQNGVRLYHLRHSRMRAPVSGQVVKTPRHFLAYRVVGEDMVIVRLLHDRMEIATQLESV